MKLANKNKYNYNIVAAYSLFLIFISG